MIVNALNNVKFVIINTLKIIHKSLKMILNAENLENVLKCDETTPK